MGSDFYTWVSFERQNVDLDAAIPATLRQLVPFLTRWFRVQVNGLNRWGNADPPQRESFDESNLDKIADLFPSDRRISKVGLSFEPLLPTNPVAGSMTIPREVVHEEAGLLDQTLPPQFQKTAINAHIHWNEQSFCDAQYFMSDWAMATYRDFLTATMDDLEVARIVDGLDLLGDWKEELMARFVYYRNPADFVRSFLDGFGLGGDPQRVLSGIREIAADDLVTKEVYHRRPDIFRMEQAGRRYVPFKRLRFTVKGAIILENKRYGVGPPSLPGDDAQGVLRDILVRQEHVGPIAPEKQRAAEGSW